jgi:mono/diheme cytochrome c family protein
MRWMMLPYFVAAAILTEQSPVLAQPVDGDPAAGRQIATKLCSSCHRVLPMTLSDRADLRVSRALLTTVDHRDFSECVSPFKPREYARFHNFKR